MKKKETKTGPDWRVCSARHLCRVNCTAKHPHTCEVFTNWHDCDDHEKKVRCIRVKK